MLCHKIGLASGEQARFGISRGIIKLDAEKRVLTTQILIFIP